MYSSHTTHALFEQSSSQKQELNKRTRYPSFKEGEIWWCAIGKNIGREIYGKGMQFTRPVYVLKKVAKEMFLGIPLTSQKKVGTWFHTIVTTKGTHYAILPQIRLFGAERIIGDRLSSLPETDQESIKNSLRNYLNL